MLLKRQLLLFLVTISLVASPSLSLTAENAVAEPPPATTAETEEAVQDPTANDRDEPEAKDEELGAGLINDWLHLIDDGRQGEGSSILAYGSKVPEDLAKTFDSIGKEQKGPGFFGVLLRSLLAIGLAWSLVFLIKKLSRKRVDKLMELAPPPGHGASLLVANLLRNVPGMIQLLLMAVVAIVLFLFMAGSVGPLGRMLFQALLGTYLSFELCRLLSTILFSPSESRLRMFPLDEHLVAPIHRALYISLAMILSGLLIIRLIAGLGAAPQTIAWVRILAGLAVIATYCYLVLFLSKPVSRYLLGQEQDHTSGWLRQQFANYWHLAALVYLLLVTFIWVGQELSQTALGRGSFIVSILIVPIFLAINAAGRALTRAAVDSLNLGQASEEELEEKGVELANREAAERKEAISVKAGKIFTLVLLAILSVWILHLWGMEIPFAVHAIDALFESLIAIALALVCWRYASSYIARKIEEASPAEEEKEEDVDDEFGGAVARGRSHTLLPMVRKVLGTVLTVMVALIVLSSLGVNIGPILAGAGVLGLAIGFGAQKLVSDVLSGFFFLLDDAFRIGEYIQTGSIRGTVENITLRNVMLRHHLGMLQIVPHSELGAVTNYMRGGIVIKFPLEFPYDTDIDKVRKIIKKVGIAMLEDEELGEDFILPVKSQGVHEITNSVMVIRVKFTAKPGKQFVIKREAFRRITEALNAKGIYYAHRKVIVDFPEENGTHDIEQREKAIQAGAAAAIAHQQQEPQQQKKEEF